ncbi:hypothetical protein DM02DRAFT_653400 [Periconia macrospinosa]|uniref:NAD(P)-binding protein n=1 Tax=Periconia macrospinosa TaxID=97972 RepID=A0A2V1DZD5_9PLEO|nr:hypothetical protein DM02DRAFT_653400 [Periconia macrospinosa]
MSSDMNSYFLLVYSVFLRLSNASHGRISKKYGIVTVRDPTHETSRSLTDVVSGEANRLLKVKLDIDVLVANAGSGTVYGDLTQVKVTEIQDLVDINALGFPASFPGVKGATREGDRPSFVLMGTPIASIGAMEKMSFPMVAYGASKAIAHYLARRIHHESPKITAFVVDPG